MFLLALFFAGGQFLLTFLQSRILPLHQPILGSQIGQGSVESFLVVMGNPSSNQVLGLQLILQRLIGNPFLAQAAVKSLDPAVGFGMMKTNANLFQSKAFQQVAKILAGKLGAVVVPEAGELSRMLIQ